MLERQHFKKTCKGFIELFGSAALPPLTGGQSGAAKAPVYAYTAQQINTGRRVKSKPEKLLSHDDLAYGWLFRHQY